MRQSKCTIIIFIIILFSTITFASAGEYDTESKVNIPPGMELKKSGDVNVLIPKGATLQKVSDLFVIESASEYSARKFEEMESRMNKIETDIESLKSEVSRKK